MSRHRTGLIHSYVEEELKEALASISQNENESMSNWIRKLVIKELNDRGVLPEQVLLGILQK